MTNTRKSSTDANDKNNAGNPVPTEEYSTLTPNRDNHKASDNNVNVDSFPQNVKSIITTLRVVVDQIDSDFKQAKELILEIARQLDEGRLCERNQISRTIKEILKDKIEQGKVTEKWIEECLPQEYKRQYTKSEPSSLSKQQPKKQIIEVSTEGEQLSPEKQDDAKGIDQPSEGQPPNKIDSANKLEQNVIPAAGELETVKQNDDTLTADSVSTIDDEYASIMPVTSDSDLEVLKTSIQEDGQCVPIVVNQYRVIIDGHLRHRACKELGIEPTIIVRQFESRLQEKEFIIESNLNRRHLNEFQRIELQIKLESIKSELAKERMSGPGAEK